MPKSRRTANFYCILLASALLAGCRTGPLPPIDLQQPGWTIRQGQAVWTPGAQGPELAGDLLVAEHADGRSVVQFTKTPFPLVTAQLTRQRWAIEFPTENKRFSAPGTPPARLGWLHVVNAIRGNIPPEPWQRIETAAGLVLRNRRTGESIEIVLD